MIAERFYRTDKHYNRRPVEVDLKVVKKEQCAAENKYTVEGLKYPGEYEGFLLIGESENGKNLHKTFIAVPKRVDSRHYDKLVDTFNQFMSESQQKGETYNESYFTGVSMQVDESGNGYVEFLNSPQYEHDNVQGVVAEVFEHSGFWFESND